MRKDGTHTAHVGSQYLGTIGNIANGIVAVTSLWADAQVYYPLQVRPYTPAARLAGGKLHPAFRTKPQLALELVQAARVAGIPFRAVVADSLYGEHPEFTRTMWQADIPFVLAIKPSEVVWTAPPEPESPWEAADRLRWGNRQNPRHPGVWTAVARRFHDGHEETWWAVDLRLGGTYGPDRTRRLVVATSDPRTLPKASTWYLVTNLPLPDTTRAREHPTLPAADLREVARLYGLRQWVEQGYKQVKQELGWADFQVRADRAIRRHWALVCCAFCFCWWAESQRDRADATALAPTPPRSPTRPPVPSPSPMSRERGKNQAYVAHAPPGISSAAPTSSWRPPSWPRALRQVQSWLDPWRVLQRCWQAWSLAPPPPPVQAVLDAVTNGQPLYLYLRL